MIKSQCDYPHNVPEVYTEDMWDRLIPDFRWSEVIALSYFWYFVCSKDKMTLIMTTILFIS